MHNETRQRPIRDFESRYSITEDGTVISFYNGRGKRSVPRILRPWITSSGYYHVLLQHNKKIVHKLVHRLVAEAFIPNPQKKPQVNHKDGQKLNNHVSNLEWCTSSENNRHAIDTGLARFARGEDAGAAKLTVNDVREIRALRNRMSTVDIAKKYGIAQHHVSRIQNKQLWAWLDPEYEVTACDNLFRTNSRCDKCGRFLSSDGRCRCSIQEAKAAAFLES